MICLNYSKPYYFKSISIFYKIKTSLSLRVFEGSPEFHLKVLDDHLSLT